MPASHYILFNLLNYFISIFYSNEFVLQSLNSFLQVLKSGVY